MDIIWNILPDLIATIALATLTIYHLMIYWGRRHDSGEKYNLYFAFFVLTVSFFIIVPYLQPGHLLASLKPQWLYVINIESVLVFGLFFFGLTFIKYLLSFSKRFDRYFLFTYACLLLSVSLTLTANFIGPGFYISYFLPVVIGITVLNALLVYFLLGYWIYKNQLFEQNFYKVLFVGFILLTANILVYRSIELINNPKVLVWNHYLSAAILYLFTYGLSVKFNSEYKELKDLKERLEQKVMERTEALEKSNLILEAQNEEILHQKKEITLINDQLKNKADQLAELDEAKSRFFAGVSHEFRTPLTLIMGPLETLSHQTDNEKTRKEYALMSRQANRLLSLINQLLDLSKLQKGMMSLDMRQDNINSFVKTILASFSSLAQEQEVALSFTEDALDFILDFDKDKMEKILNNLVSNAIKFTPAGGTINTTIKLTAEKQFLLLTVSDTGEGIEATQLKKIFDPYYQVETSVKHNYDSTGVGLALVKELVELHGGSIRVQSVLHEGSVFEVQLPVKNLILADRASIQSEWPGEPDMYPNLITTADPEKRQTNKTVILLVEDNLEMRHFIKSSLWDDYRIEEAINGQAGIDKIQALMPDLVIADIIMPVIDGIEMTKRIKQDARVSHIPVILLTGKASVESKIEGLSTSADDYITKPFNVAELKLRIHNLIETRKKLREKFSRQLVVNPSEIVTTSADESFLIKALNAVEQNMSAAEFGTDEFCAAVNMSRANVHRKLKALTDQSTTEFIRTIRLKRAAQLLLQKSASVSEIAYDTGFNNLSYFTRCFKEVYGVLPSEYA
jgi:signal transduction histidine kinase/DNA-binding response OmpR family regulator